MKMLLQRISGGYRFSGSNVQNAPHKVQTKRHVANRSHSEDDDEHALDTFDSYDARVERQSALDALKRPHPPPVARTRLSIQDVNTAMHEANEGCCGTKGVTPVSMAQCAALWDIADEVWHAYMRQMARDDEEAKEKLEGEAWSLKRRTYDL